MCRLALSEPPNGVNRWHTVRLFFCHHPATLSHYASRIAKWVHDVERRPVGVVRVSARKTVFISVAEDSADMHGAALVRSAAESLPGVTFRGFAGPRLQAAGVAPIGDLTRDAVMLTGVAKALGKGWAALRTAQTDWRTNRPDAVIVMDSSALHLPMAAGARKLGLRVLYYIAPQTWASRAYRNRRLARDVERVACILPFEEAYFRSRDVDATFVGHPLFEHLAADPVEASGVQRLRSAGRPLVAILPGSRRQVIASMLPRQLDVVSQMDTAVEFAISAASERQASQIRAILERRRQSATVLVDRNATLLTAADLVLVASGTATLQVAAYRKPMVVMYDAGRLLRALYPLLGRFVLTTTHLSLVNILADAPVVPEFMPFIRSTRPIATVADELLTDVARREAMMRDLDRLVTPLEQGGASRRVCEMLGEMLEG